MGKPSKALARAAEQFPASVQTQLTELETKLGGRAGLCGLLALAPLTKDMRILLGVLGDPRNDRVSLAAALAQANLLPGELLKLLGNAALHRGQVLARQAVGDALPAVVSDVMRKAAPYEEACSGCQGLGQVTPNPTTDQPNPSPVPCPLCQATGRLIYQPDLETQKLAIEMGGMVSKGGGIHLTNQQVTVGSASGAGGGALEQLQRLTDDILYGDPVDGTIVPPPDEDAAPAAEGSNPP